MVSCCQECSEEVHKERMPNNPYHPKSGDGFPPAWNKELDAVRMRHMGKTITINIKHDRPCRQCNKKCTPGDKSCWWCGVAAPC